MLTRDSRCGDSACLGIYSDGFANCKAIILESDVAIGLAHTSEDHQELDALIDRYVADFSCEGGADIKLTIGYAVQTLRECYLDEMGQAGTADDYLSECLGPEQAGVARTALAQLDGASSESEKRGAIADALTAQDRREVLDWARRRNLTILEMPHSALLLWREAGVDCLRGPPEVTRAQSVETAGVTEVQVADLLMHGAS